MGWTDRKWLGPKSHTIYSCRMVSTSAVSTELIFTDSVWRLNFIRFNRRRCHVHRMAVFDDSRCSQTKFHILIQWFRSLNHDDREAWGKPEYACEYPQHNTAYAEKFFIFFYCHPSGCQSVGLSTALVQTETETELWYKFLTEFLFFLIYKRNCEIRTFQPTAVP